MTALIGIVLAVITVCFLVPLLRQRRGPQDQPSPTTAIDDSSSSWSGSATPVALGLAAGESDHSNRSESHRDENDRAGESGWGEHGASGSWGEEGDSAGDSDNGDSGGDSGGDSND